VELLLQDLAKWEGRHPRDILWDLALADHDYVEIGPVGEGKISGLPVNPSVFEVLHHLLVVAGNAELIEGGGEPVDAADFADSVRWGPGLPGGCALLLMSRIHGNPLDDEERAIEALRSRAFRRLFDLASRLGDFGVDDFITVVFAERLADLGSIIGPFALSITINATDRPQFTSFETTERHWAKWRRLAREADQALADAAADSAGPEKPLASNDRPRTGTHG